MAFEHMSEEEIRAQIADISARLKGPRTFPQCEAMMLHLDRKDLRAELERRGLARCAEAKHGE